MTTTQTNGKGRGFSSMSPEQRSAIARKGGKAAHALGTAHKWTPREASEAGKVGGRKSKRRRSASPNQ